MAAKDRSGERVAATSTGTLMRVRRAHVIILGKALSGGLGKAMRGQALQEGLTGYTRATPTGREAVFEGGTEDIEVMIDWLRQRGVAEGVEVVEVTWEAPKGFGDFEVR